MPDVTPRIVVTDSLGRRLIPIDKTELTLGRRSDNDVTDAVTISRGFGDLPGDG